MSSHQVAGFVEPNIVSFDAEEYPNGLNSKFMASEPVTEESIKTLEERFAGKGTFENPELRDIAANVEPVMDMLKEKCKLGPGKVVLDLGAGTGLFLERLAQETSMGDETKRVFACELSQTFVEMIRRKFGDLVEPVQTTGREIPGVPDKSCDIVFVCDVYHHLEFPVAVMTECKRLLKDDGLLVILDFHRDSSRIKSHPAGWVEKHVRADQATFRQEIESAGFTHHEEVVIETLIENYIMLFRK